MAGSSQIHPLLAFHLNQFGDDESLVLEVFSMFKDPDDVVSCVKLLKEEGNISFKKGDFGFAVEVYSRAIAYLGALVILGVISDLEVSDLALAINLNLAACALKLGRFHEVLEICSLVLRVDQSNVKALFRRAMAFDKLGNLESAFKDLVSAKELNPSNLDIIKNLDSIHERIMDKEECFIPSHMEGIILDGQGEGAQDQEEKGLKLSMGERDNSGVLHQSSSENSISEGAKSSTMVGISNPQANERPVIYKNRLNPSKSLAIPKPNMEKLKQGKHISFYDHFSSSVISIRLLPIILDRDPINPGDQKIEEDSVTFENHILSDAHIDISMVAEASTEPPSSFETGNEQTQKSDLDIPWSTTMMFGLYPAKKRAAREALNRALLIARNIRGRGQKGKKFAPKHRIHHPSNQIKAPCSKKRKARFSTLSSTNPKKRYIGLSMFSLSSVHVRPNGTSFYCFP